MTIMANMKKSKSAGFAASAVIGVVMTLALATTVMMNMAQTSAKVSNTINKHNQTADTMSVLSVAASQNSKFEGPGGISWAPLPIRTASFSDAGAGLVPANFGASQKDAAGNPIKYCAYANGGAKTPSGNEVAPLTINTSARSFYEVKNAPSFALISAGRNGVMETTCESLLKHPSGNAASVLKTPSEISDEQRNSGVDDVIVARTVDQSNGIQGEGVKNLMTNLTSCDWKTQKLVYNDVGGQAQFDCVKEQDQNVTAQNAGTGGVGVLAGQEMVPDQYGNPKNNIKLRNIVAGSGIALSDGGNANNIVISSTGGGAVTNEGGSGARVLVDGESKLRRIVAGSNVTVNEITDGSGNRAIQIASTGGGGTDPDITNIINCAKQNLLWNGTACAPSRTWLGTLVGQWSGSISSTGGGSYRDVHGVIPVPAGATMMQVWANCGAPAMSPHYHTTQRRGAFLAWGDANTANNWLNWAGGSPYSLCSTGTYMGTNMLQPEGISRTYGSGTVATVWTLVPVLRGSLAYHIGAGSYGSYGGAFQESYGFNINFYK